MNLDMSGLFHVCQGTCLCASSSSEGYGKGKVLYCYGEVVLQRANLRSGGEEGEENSEELYTFQIIQLISIVVLLLALLLVLVTIKQGLTRIQKQVKRILVLMPPISQPPSRPNTLEKKQNEKQLILKKAPNGDCAKHRDNESGGYKLVDNGLRDPYRGERDSIRFEKEEIRSLNHFSLHDKIERMDSFPESMTEVT
ncbi:uncharacterized protein LOC111716156 [Eurytemora carolleeae]|uniref:uncharacterized protein LOC111716156 n=1 Tax=Eurytemora carolleeae TaxID=1294199 RepID=UPI000C78D44A|nr:uncharacterized protein LOC111716156 [Eurytemora carolleeae]XP_023347354.1 uncharacterized protein LOC111716156 [Eurytemora carolleeae]|eukprot:XP_023347353.1 uncharacterized protein LOC111716156 [Eurytemora affinis]